jgi:hypothetical protein
MFSEAPSLFVKDKRKQAGIYCRFGMQGIVAEAHFDSGRNFIAMVQGRKRYIIAPPGQCPHLSVLTSGRSERHSRLDWSDPASFASLQHAQAIEVILEPGDVLYLPAFWFHYIVSLGTNIQCNTRSGTPDLHTDDIRRCGFSVSVTEGGRCCVRCCLGFAVGYTFHELLCVRVR